MKKLFAWLLVLTMCVSMFAGCGQEATPTTTPTEAPTQATEAPVVEDLSDPEGLASALEYLQTIYKNAGGLTPKDFTRIGTVPVGAKKFEVVWTASVGEDLVKAVRGEDGMVTIDVNEECDTETPYTLTATITDAAGNSVSHAWEHILPASLSAEEILNQAYALTDGQSLPFEATLTGVVTSVDTLWSDQYGNITVTIVVEGFENMPIQCYRLAGDGAKDICVGDTLTVTGTIKNYKGTIEFDQGCVLDNRIYGGGTAPGEKEYVYFWHLNDGDRVVIYNRNSKMALSSEKTGYYNVGKKITKDATGKVSGYGPKEVWTVRFNGYSYSFIDSEGNEMALDKEYSNLSNSSSYNKWKLVRISSTKYMIENVDRKGYFLEWYDKYDNFSTYNPANPENDKQFIFSFYQVPKDEIVEDGTTYFDATPVENPVAGKAYKLVLFQNQIGKELGFTGKMSGYYAGTSEDLNEVVDVYLESADGGYMMYFMNGSTKTYINLIPRSDGKAGANVALETTGKTVYTLNNEFKYLSGKQGSDTFYLGNYGTNATISASKISYIEDTSKIGVSQFTAWLADTVRVSGPTVEPEEPDVPGEGGDTEETTGTTITFDSQSKMTSSSSTEQVWEENGITFTYSKGNSNNFAVYANPIRCYQGTNIKIAYPGMTKIVFVCAADKILAVDGAVTNGNVVTITLDAPADSYSINLSAQARFDSITVYTSSNGGSEDDDNVTTEPELPAADSLLTIPEVIEVGAIVGDKYTSNKYYVSGEIVNIASTEYGNMTIKDANGKTLYIHGTYNADGTIGYSQMETKPVVGDAVKLYGIIGQYNGTTQMKNAWITEHVPGEVEEVQLPDDGQYVIAVKYNGTYYALDTTIASKVATVAVTVEDGAVTSSDAPVWTIAKDKNAETPAVTLSNGTAYLAYNSSTNFKTSSAAYSWTVAHGLSDDAINLTSGTRAVAYQYNSGNSRFGAYAISNASNSEYSFDLYLLPVSSEGGGEEPDVPGEGGGEEPDVPGEVGETTTVTISIADYAGEHSWTDSKSYSSIEKQGVKITTTATPVGNYGLNTGKYYVSNNSWRIYQNEKPTMTVAVEGKTIVSVKFTYSAKNSGTLTMGGQPVSSGTVTAVNAATAELSVGNTGSQTNGNVQITAIEIVYG